MPAVSKTEAAERLAAGVERAKPSDLPEIYAELFPERPPGATPAASEIGRHIFAPSRANRASNLLSRFVLSNDRRRGTRWADADRPFDPLAHDPKGGRPMKRRGFTLIELLVVIAIVAVLIAL